MEKREVSKYPASNSLDLERMPTYKRTIHVYETDKDGVVHFSNYFKIAEEALYAGLKHFGFSFENSGYSMAMINAQAHYMHPIKFAEQLSVVIAEINVKRSKLLFTLDFNNNHLINLAKIQLIFVLIDPQKRKAIPVPKPLKVSLSQTIINHDKKSYPFEKNIHIVNGNQNEQRIYI